MQKIHLNPLKSALKTERFQCFVLPVTLLVSLPGTFRTFFAWLSRGSLRVPCLSWIEVDLLHSVSVAGLLYCLDHSVQEGAVITLVSNYRI